MDMDGLLETRCDGFKPLLLSIDLGFSQILGLGLRVLQGYLVYVEQIDLHITLFHENQRFLHVDVRYGDAKKWFLTLVYSSSKEVEIRYI